MKAHQRLIREQLIGAAVLEGRWNADSSDVDLGTATAREILPGEARDLVVQNEYLATMPIAARHCFGLFFGDRLGVVVVYSSEYGENLGVWDRYGYTGKIIGLLRGCPAYWAPQNASKLIRASMALLPPQYKVVTATVDPRAGEIGAVDQAAGFDYVGTMTAGGRLRIQDGDKTISERSARRRYGTSSASALEALGLTIERVPRKGRYFAFRGSHRERRERRSMIADRIKPYPKRSAVVTHFAGGVVIQPGFVRVRRRQRKEGGLTLVFDLLRSQRIDGTPRHAFIMTLGSWRSDRSPSAFWSHVMSQMITNRLSATQRQRLIGEMVRKGAPPLPGALLSPA